jgi:hypothetical protein
MSQDSTNPPSWDVVAAELRACREQQKQTWGELDSALIGRYLAGEVNDEERSLVDASLEAHPELRVLTEIVNDVLIDCPPVAPVESAAQPRILSFSSAKPAKKSRFQRQQRLFALAAAACLMLGLGIVLERQYSAPTSGRPIDEHSLFASRGGVVNTSFKTDGSTSRPDPELWAMADSLVEGGEFEKAAHVLFDTQKKVAPRVQAPVAPPQKPGMNRAVVHLAERVLDKMPAREPLQKKDSVGFAPAGGAGGHENEIKFVSNDDKRGDTRGWILNKSLPYLVDGVKQQDDRALQRRSAEAIGRMGHFASPAVSQLAETLRNSECPIQQTVLADVFKQLGPDARPAARDIEYVAGKCCKEVQPHAREALAAVRMPDWIGVRDNARVLDEKVRHRVNERIRELARVHHIHVVAETVASLPQEARETYFAYKGEKQREAYFSSVTAKRSHEVGADRGVYLLICMDPPAVQVALGDEAKSSKPTADVTLNAARDRLEQSIKAKGRAYDKEIEEAVQSIEQALAK